MKTDKRYTITLEYHGKKEPSYIVRFCGKWVKPFDTKQQADLFRVQELKRLNLSA